MAFFKLFQDVTKVFDTWLIVFGSIKVVVAISKAWKWVSRAPSSVSTYRNDDKWLTKVSSSPDTIINLSSTINLSF
jgi:hypothetical protein